VTDFRHTQVAAGASSLHVVEAGAPDAPPVLFLHGWPQSWYSWRRVLEAASSDMRAIAVDLPGIGRSAGDPTDGSKRELAGVVHRLIAALELRDVTLVGHDVGGMIAYSYLRGFDDVTRVAILDVVIPGIEPWEAVLRNPYIWHFAMHAIPELPERLIHGRQTEYFDYFFGALAADPATITTDAREAYVEAHASKAALTAGLNWYRAFPRDAEHNRETLGRPVTLPVLYVRGEHETGQIGAYIDGLRTAGVAQLEQGIVPAAGHFTPDEAPGELWRLLAGFTRR
jgi:pimeloyl-ACP methyl ester carboxylesterase